jgi:hypothetical protein|tara:strand:- start:6 stop:158 length:153 start_codon:yes stop_codon:yes gene_type:complete
MVKPKIRFIDNDTSLFVFAESNDDNDDSNDEDKKDKDKVILVKNLRKRSN